MKLMLYCHRGLRNTVVIRQVLKCAAPGVLGAASGWASRPRSPADLLKKLGGRLLQKHPVEAEDEGRYPRSNICFACSGVRVTPPSGTLLLRIPASASATAALNFGWSN